MDEKVMEIDLKALVNIFRKRWAWIAASTVAGFLILLMVSLFMLPRKYTSSVSLYVNNLTSVSLTGDVNINDINASQKLVDTYIVILQDDDVLQQVADEAPEQAAGQVQVGGGQRPAQGPQGQPQLLGSLGKVPLGVRGFQVRNVGLCYPSTLGLP